MPINVYPVGQRIRLAANFDVLGSPTDPDTAVLKIRPPGSSEPTVLSPARDSTGAYFADVDLTVPGHWHWRWEGSGACTAVDEGVLTVQPSKVL